MPKKPSKVVICSKTQMGKNRFCSCVMNANGEQFRVNFGRSHLSDGFLTRQGIGSGLWVPRRVVRLRKASKQARRRPTHPEDTIFVASSIEMAGILKERVYIEIIAKVIKDDPREIFGTAMPEAARSKVVDPLLEDEIIASVGYLGNATVYLYTNDWGKPRANIVCENRRRLDIPVTCIQTMAEMKAGKYTSTIQPFAVRLGISHPFQPQSYDREFCFIQMTGLVL